MKKLLTLALVSLGIVGTLFAQTADEILEKYQSLPVPLYSTSTLTIEMIGKNGNLEETRKLVQYGNHKDDVIRTVFDFKSPQKWKDTRFLQLENKEKEDDKWIYLPELRSVRRVNTAERQKAFVGLDFTYNDMTIRDYKNDKNTLLGEETIDVAGNTYSIWKIESVPEKSKNVEYAKRIQYIDKATYLPVKIEFFDKQGRPVKTYTIEAIKKEGNYLIRQKNRMVTERTGHNTVVYVDSIVCDKEVEDRYFTQNWLSTGK